MKYVVGFVAALVVLSLAGLAFVFSGVYDIGATSPHSRFGYWVLDTTMRQSVQSHAEGIAPPLRFSEAQIESGLRSFQETCVMCHGGPGVERFEIGEGLRPEPPELSRAVARWSSTELFWIVKHGIKMSGMPAFGSTHEDERIWDIVAFLERLPSLTPEEYQALAQAALSEGEGHGGGETGHGEN